MSEDKTTTSEELNWQIQAINEGKISLDCPSCENHYEYSSTQFDENADEQINGLTKTEGAIIPQGDSKMLAITLALLAYYFSHRMINGPGAPLNQGILLPVFIAVLAHTLTKVVVAGLWNLFGKKLPIYEFQCSQCQAKSLIASNGIQVAFPQKVSDTSDTNNDEEKNLQGL